MKTKIVIGMELKKMPGIEKGIDFFINISDHVSVMNRPDIIDVIPVE